MAVRGPSLLLLSSAILVVALAGTAAARPHGHRPAAAPRIGLAVDGTNETRNLPLLVAERLGYFRDEGLVVTLVDSPATPSPAELMKDGRADGAVAFYHHTFMSQADDHLVTEAVVTLGVSPGLKVLVAKRLEGKVRSAGDLKGLRVFTGGSQSGKTTSANWFARRGGLRIDDFVHLAPVGHEQMARALRDGEADAIISHEPDADDFVAQGDAFELADLSSPQGTRAALGEPYPSTTVYLPRAYVDAHSGAVQHLVNACLRALVFINSHNAEEIAAVLPPLKAGKDRVVFLKTLAEDKKMFATDGLMPASAAREEWSVMSALTPKYRSIDLKATWSNRFVEAWRRAHPGAL